MSVVRNAVNGHGHTFLGTVTPTGPSCTRSMSGPSLTQWATSLRCIVPVNAGKVMRPLSQHLQGFSPVDLPRLNDIRISQSSVNA